jgi:multidrug resistance efflux pump
MRTLLCLTLAGLPLLGAGCSEPVSASPQGRETNGNVPLEAKGKTQPAPGRSATIAPVVLHDVVEVKVAPGDRVKKEQVLVKLDDDEPQADVRARKAALAEMKASLERLKAQPREEERSEARATLESAEVSAEEARHVLERLEPLYQKGASPEWRVHEARNLMKRAEADRRAAKARLDRLLRQPITQEIAEAEARVATAQANLESAVAELEHYTVTAPIDGVISWLEVNLGTVSRPGTSVWGEILDLTELDVRCDLPPRDADRLSVGQAAEVCQEGRKETWTGKVVYVGVAADARTGLIPVLIRLKNPDERLRCRVEVQVRFGTGTIRETRKD